MRKSTLGHLGGPYAHERRLWALGPPLGYWRVAEGSRPCTDASPQWISGGLRGHWSARRSPGPHSGEVSIKRTLAKVFVGLVRKSSQLCIHLIGVQLQWRLTGSHRLELLHHARCQKVEESTKVLPASNDG
jgi:hypothetical protein